MRSDGGMGRVAVLAVTALAITVLAVLVLRPAAAPTPPAATGSPAPPSISATASATFVGAGDIADCAIDGDSQTAAILDGLPGAQIFTLGDNAYENGTRREFDECYGPTWGRHFDRTWPSPGNHEYNTPSAAGYFDYFGGRAGPDRRGWYAFDLGAWRIYSLNSNCAAIGRCTGDSEQVRWLREDLQQHRSECALAFMHHPRFSSGEHGSDPSVEVLWAMLHEAGVEVVLAGHEHSYERFEPMDGAGSIDREHGTTLIVAGTGGRHLRGFGAALPSSVARASAWGVVELTLDPGGWSSQFIPVAGAGFTDEAGGTCH